MFLLFSRATGTVVKIYQSITIDGLANHCTILYYTILYYTTVILCFFFCFVFCHHWLWKKYKKCWYCILRFRSACLWAESITDTHVIQHSWMTDDVSLFDNSFLKLQTRLWQKAIMWHENNITFKNHLLWYKRKTTRQKGCRLKTIQARHYGSTKTCFSLKVCPQ